MNATTHIRGFIGYAFISNRRWFFLIGMQLVSLLPFPQSFLKEELGKKKECLSIKKKTAQFEKALLIWKKKKNVSGTEAIPPLSSWNRWLHFSVRLFFTVQKFPGRLFRNAEKYYEFLFLLTTAETFMYMRWYFSPLCEYKTSYEFAFWILYDA